MELTPAHLRYLLAIYEVSQTHLDISSRSIAEKLGVTKPSVVRVLNLLMERGMIVKEYITARSTSPTGASLWPGRSKSSWTKCSRTSLRWRKS